MHTIAPSGLVTLLFADVEGSTAAWQARGPEYADLLAGMHGRARAEAERCGGRYVKHTGDGFLLAFADPAGAVQCAHDLLAATSATQAGIGLRLRIGIHTDLVEVQEGEYVGLGVWKAHRVMDAAHGGQILLSEASYALLADTAGSRCHLACEPLGSYQLRDLETPVRLFRLACPELGVCPLPPRALPESRGNLPPEDRPFVGRDGEVRDLCRLVRERGARLVTVTGIGGIGKTRIAQHVARLLREDFLDGVWFVALDGLDDRQQVAAALCAGLGVRVEATPPEEALSAALPSKSALVVLDCFDRLVCHAGLIESIVHAAPGLRFLVTSRRVLGVSSEYEFSLEPMDVADAPGREPCDSAALFCDAAAHVLHDFELTPAVRSCVLELCRELDGIPLALVLAAGRLRHLSLGDLVRQVRERRFAVLRRTAGPPDRHEAMERVVDDSLCLVPEGDRRLLRCLSVFVGGLYLQDLAAVWDAPEADTLDAVSRLRDHSLVQVELTSERARYRLLDTVREYASAMVGDEVELRAWRERHADRYAAAACEANRLMTEGRWPEGSARLWDEIGNFRAAVDFSIAQRCAVRLVSFVGTLGRLYLEAGLWADFGALADSAEWAAEHLGRQDVLARIAGLRGALAARRGDRSAASRFWGDRLHILSTIGDTAGAVDTLLDLSNLARDGGDRAAARRMLRQALTRAARNDERGLLAVARVSQAELALDEGDHATARRAALAARRTVESCDDKDAALYVYGHLGLVHRSLGETGDAEACLTTAVRLAHEGWRTFNLIAALVDLGELLERRGSLHRAAYAYTAAARVHPDLDSRRTARAAEALARFRCEHGPDSAGQSLDAAVLHPMPELVSCIIDGPGVCAVCCGVARAKGARDGERSDRDGCDGDGARQALDDAVRLE